MAVRESRITYLNGVLGPLSLIDVKRLKQLSKLIEPANARDKEILGNFEDYLDHIIEQETTIGKI